MRKKFNSLKGKLNLKILSLIPMIFFLTGCGNTEYLHQTWGIGNLGNLLNFMGEKIEILGLAICEGFDSLFAGLILFLYGIPNLSKTFSISNLESYANFFNIITIVQVLAVVMIIVNYAKSVAKHNLMQQGSGVSAITHLKKISVALVATFLVPYICISAYMASVYGSAALTSMLKTNEGSTSETWRIFEQMSDDHVALSTYCEAGQKEFGVSDLTGLVSTDDKISGNKKYEVILTDSSLYSKYCGDTSNRNVFEYINKSETYKRVLVIGGSLKSTDILGQLGEAINESMIGSTFVGLAFFIVFLVIAFGFLISLLRRIVDLMVLIATSWFYIGSSVADDPNENSIASLWKKLLAICLTNFLMTFEFCLWLLLVVDTTSAFSLTSLLASFVWMRVLLATPTAVESMVTSTNTLSNMGSSAATAGRVAGKFLNK